MTINLRSQQLVNEANELIEKRNKLSLELMKLLEEIPLWNEFANIENEIYEMTNKIHMQETVEHCKEEEIELFAMPSHPVPHPWHTERDMLYVSNLERPEDIPQGYLSNDEAKSVYWKFYRATKDVRESHTFTTIIERYFKF